MRIIGVLASEKILSASTCIDAIVISERRLAYRDKSQL